MSIAEIKQFLLKFQISEPTWVGGIIPVLQQLTFSAVNHVTVKQGVYTPNNDYLYLAQSIPADKAPNFIFLATPTTANLSLMSNGNMVLNSAPVGRMHMQLISPDSPMKIDNVFFEGRTNVPSIMPQGVPAEYFFIMAQATF